MTYEDLKTKLDEKLEAEFIEYRKDLAKNYTPDEIIDKSYETTFKEQIINYISCEMLGRREIKALLKKNNALDDLYDRWEESDGDIWEMLEDNIRTSVDKIATEYDKNKEKER